jgi:hypothetical protein
MERRGCDDGNGGGLSKSLSINGSMETGVGVIGSGVNGPDNCAGCCVSTGGALYDPRGALAGGVHSNPACAGNDAPNKPKHETETNKMRRIVKTLNCPQILCWEVSEFRRLGVKSQPKNGGKRGVLTAIS